MYYTQNSAKPCAFITKEKQRLKQFGQNVYLSNGSEFELELFNPTSNTVLAKIKFNGKLMSGGGIVIKPGQRIFLERYFDDPKKFKFETYEVDADNKEVANAISNNGDVSVEFYDEKIEFNTDWFNPNYFGNNYYYRNNLYNDYSLNNMVGTTTTNSYYNSTSNTATMDSLGTFEKSSYTSKQTPRRIILSALRSKSMETGTVEKGSNSNQSFSYVNKEFNSFTSSVSYWKIIPESQKPYEKQDIKVFCTECGTKRKKDSHKFCPNCGTKY
jgi:hypothetical protein